MLPRLLHRLIGRAAGWSRRGASTAIESADRLIVAGNEAERAGDARRACSFYRRAVAAAPGYAKAHLNLGIGREAAGDGDAAVQSFETALALDPAGPYAHYNLGKLLHTRGDPVGAERHVGAALELKPDFAEARVVLADVLDARGDVAGAARELERVLAQQPAYPGALYNYALILTKLGRLAQAESALRRLLALDAAYPLARFRLGSVLHAQGEAAQAEPLLHAAAEADPQAADVRIALFRMHESLGRSDLALAELDRAAALRPDWAEHWFYRGVILNRLQRVTESEAALRRAVELRPGLAEAYRVLAAVLFNQLRIDEGLDVYGAGKAHDAEGYVAASELFALNYWHGISAEALFERHRHFGRKVETKTAPLVARFGNSRDPERRLRLGYVSGDLYYHAVGMFLVPLLERHDRSAYEVHCYSLNDKDDQVTRQIVERTDVWHRAHAVPHRDVAQRINGDGIDILVDLSGHSGFPAFDIFVLRPAPVQASWLGYLCTTGLTRIDYRITDACADPPGEADRLHSETLVRLPHTQWCYRSFVSIDVSPEPPCARNGFVTFGSFNQTPKLSRPLRRLWADVLRRVPGSRLVVVGTPPGPAADRIVREFAEDGIDADRVVVEARVPYEDFFRKVDGVDIALDSMPYSGGTTTCDCLWMGVPVLTLPGSRSVSRSAASILTTLRLPEWIASTPEDYVLRATAAAADIGRLRELRASLRTRMRASALMDEPGFARDIEAAYRMMWRAWCAGAR
jgi:protein O-GlcNAc transferase